MPNELIPCDVCGNGIYEDDLIAVEHGTVHVCRDCYDAYARSCSVCGEMYLRTNMHSLRVEYDGYGYVCPECAESDSVAYCDCCDNYVRSDDYSWDECIWCADEEYDDDCDNDENSLIKHYHAHKGYERFYGTDSNLYIGIELEVDGGDDPENCASDIRDIAGDRLYFEHDGSLSGDGIEIISQPHTLAEFQNIPWQEVMRICDRHGYRSHDAGNCGLHVHLSRAYFGETELAQKDNLSKLVYFYDKYYDELFKASRRRWGQCDHYCHKSGFAHAREIRRHLNIEHGHVWDRYCAVNLSNYPTVEIRLGRGTLRYESFDAWIDMTVVIAQNICDIGWTDLNNPMNVLEGIKPETVEYLKSRNAFQGVL